MKHWIGRSPRLDIRSPSPPNRLNRGCGLKSPKYRWEGTFAAASTFCDTNGSTAFSMALFERPPRSTFRSTLSSFLTSCLNFITKKFSAWVTAPV